MKSLKQNRRSHQRRGSVILLTAFGLVLFAGCAAIAVDYGLLVADANRLQRGCDAGALAGAQLLKVTGDDNYDTYQAKTVAVQVAAQNNITVDPNNVTFLNNNTQIRVPSVTTRAYFFARVLGQTSGNVNRSATAGVAAGNGLTTATGDAHLVPIGITWETYKAYKDDRTASHDIELVRQNKQTFAQDDLVLFDLRMPSGKSGAHMMDELTGADVEVSSIGDAETTLNAAQPSEQIKFERGLDTLLDRSAVAPWNDGDHSGVGSKYDEILAGTSPRDNPRVMYLIVTPSTANPSNGTFNTEVQGYAPVYVTSYYEVNISGEKVIRMRMRFLPPGTAGDSDVTINPGGTLSGMRVVSLIN